MRVANIILNDFPMGSAKKLGVTNKNLRISPIGLLIMTRLLIFIWQKCHGVGNFDWVLYLAVKSRLKESHGCTYGTYRLVFSVHKIMGMILKIVMTAHF